MKKIELTELHLKACRKPRFKAGADLAKKVNRILIHVDHTVSNESDSECLDVDLEWESEAEVSDCNDE